MTEDYKRGFITGLAIKPLYVGTTSDTMVSVEMISVIEGVETNDCHCVTIDFTEV